MTKTKWARIHSDFDKTTRKAFPNKSMYQITKELNKLLENVIYGKKKE